MPADRPTAIAEGVIRAMFVHKLRFVPALVVIGLLAAGAVLAGSGRGADPEPPRPESRGAAKAEDRKEPPDPLVVRFRVVHPQPGGVLAVSHIAASAEAGRELELFAAIPGTIRSVKVDLGDRIKAGDILADIDSPTLGLDVRQAAAGVQQVEGLLKEAEARVTIARTELDAAKGALRLRQIELPGAKEAVEPLKKRLDIVNESYKRGTGSLVDQVDAEGQYRAAQVHAEAAVSAVDTAKSELLVKEAKLVQADAGVATARANVQSARVGLEKSEAAFAQTMIRAPFDGVVAVRKCQPGDMVRSGEGANPTPLFTVMRSEVLRVVFWLPEDLATRTEAGQAVEVTFFQPVRKVVTGKVVRLGVTVEPLNQTVRVELEVPNPNREFRPGTGAQITINHAKMPTGLLRVPRSAVVDAPPAAGQSSWGVYVYKDGKARLTRVEGGRSDRDEIEIVSGVTAEDLIVADPKDLAPRAEVPVEVEKPAPPK
jgi:HlyD family secretion protein